MIYFIYSELVRQVRIGAHPDPWSLTKQMQMHHENSCMLMATKDGGGARLQQIHDRFKREQRMGSWYHLSTRLEEFIYNTERTRLTAEPLRRISLREAEALIGISRTTIARWMKRKGIEALTNHNIFDAEEDYYGRNAKAGRYEQNVQAVSGADVRR